MKRFRNSLLAVVAVLSLAFGVQLVRVADAQNVNLSGAFYQYGGLGVGSAPTGTSGSLVASAYSWPATSTVASAATIAPLNGVVHVSIGAVTAVATITVPAICGLTCAVTLIPDGAFTTTTAGNINIASTAVSGRALVMTWDNSSGRWSPSY